MSEIIRIREAWSGGRGWLQKGRVGPRGGRVEESRRVCSRAFREGKTTPNPAWHPAAARREEGSGRGQEGCRHEPQPCSLLSAAPHSVRKSEYLDGRPGRRENLK